MKTAQDLIQLLHLTQEKENYFKAYSQPIGSPIVFGGQVLAQAINAAYRCVPEDRILHSLHSYFILPGNLDLPIYYQVQVIRDGGSFSVRRVLAKQNNEIIFILAASFKKIAQNGYQFQTQMPKVPMPEELLSWKDIYQQTKEFLPKSLKLFLEIERPMEFKPTKNHNPLDNKPLSPDFQVWIKPTGYFNNDLKINQQILTYISDYNILSTALRPHADQANFGNTLMASLDHSMWFHRDFDWNDWLLYSLTCNNTNKEMGLVRGEIFTRDGKLVATAAQEGLIRAKKKKTTN